MRSGTTAAIGIVACLPLVLLATGVPIPWLTKGDVRAIAQSVPAGDCELAWLHTTTNSATWERFVTGFQRATLVVSGLSVDDSQAFPNDTTTVPELSAGLAGQPGRMRIRWYKISNEATHADWVRELAARNPAPLAVIGGGSSDRAADLARAMNAQTDWHGERPLLLLSTASAVLVPEPTNALNDLPDMKPLMDIYDDRTFRFCFSNRQLAESTVDLIWSQPDLAPKWLAEPSLPALWGTAARIPNRPHVIVLQWEDDPFSTDLREQFRGAVFRRVASTGGHADLVTTNPISFSIGGYYTANRHERNAAEFVIDELRRNPERRSMLVLPTVTAAARRVLRTVCDAIPNVGARLVVVNGDGIPMNAIYRDAEFVWPADALPVPLVLFAHANPIGWDEGKDELRSSFTLKPPTSTEDVLLFAELANVAVSSAFSTESGLVANATIFRDRIRERFPNEFDRDGNRRIASGEYTIILKPKRERRDAQIDIWRHVEKWEFVRSLKVPPTKAGRGGNGS